MSCLWGLFNNPLQRYAIIFNYRASRVKKFLKILQIAQKTVILQRGTALRTLMTLMTLRTLKTKNYDRETHSALGELS